MAEQRIPVEKYLWFALPAQQVAFAEHPSLAAENQQHQSSVPFALAAFPQASEMQEQLRPSELLEC
jgi:hypothetical protein